jgi:hypothetical protein
MRYRVTRGGVVFTIALLLVAAAAALSANNLLFLIAAAMLATLLVSGFVSRLSRQPSQSRRLAGRPLASPAHLRAASDPRAYPAAEPQVDHAIDIDSD